MTELLTGRRRGRAFGEDLRRRTVAAVLDKGMTLRAASRQFDVNWQSIARWVNRYRERGHVRADPRGGDLQSWRIEAERERERIVRLLERRPMPSVRALRDVLAAEGAVLGTATVQRFLKRYGLERDRRLAGRRTGFGARKRRRAS